MDPTPGTGAEEDTAPPACLVGAAGSRHVLRDGMRIGRASQCDVVLSDSSVSRDHAVIRRAATHWVVVDQGSRNGAVINGSRIPMLAECRLRDGDRLEIGRVVLHVWLGGLEDPEQTSGITPAPAHVGEVLSPYQLQVVRCLAEPWTRGGQPATNAQIAAALGTPQAVDAIKAALRRAYLKVGLAATPTHAKRRELCRLAQDRRWI
jgi:hypothetical protein